MNALKANKFRVGDYVEIINHKNTVDRFGGNTIGFPQIGLVGVVNKVTDHCVGIVDHMYLMDASDVELLETSDQRKEETQVYNTSITKEGIKSDGGSSDYYFTKLPQELIDQIVKTGGIEIKDIARYVYDNNADAFNIIKAQKRIIEANKGVGKAGITKLYDAKKISFFANEQYEAIKREGNNG